MAHLTINGVEVDCTSSELTLAMGGETVRSFNGRPRNTGRYRAKEYRFTTDAGGLLRGDAQRLRALLLGDGHAWSFNADVNSSRKLMPTSGTGYGIDVGFWNSGLRLNPGTGTITWNLSGDADWLWTQWTVMHWRFSGGEWHHWIRTSLGDSWRDGLAAPAPGDMTFSSSTAVLTFATTPAGITIDDLVALPFALPLAWVNAVENFTGEKPWPDLPYVRAGGPGVDEDEGVNALGEVGQVRRVPVIEGSNSVSKEVFDFTLRGL